MQAAFLKLEVFCTKKAIRIVIVIFLILSTAIRVDALSRVHDPLEPATPAIMPYLIRGDGIVLEQVALELDLGGSDNPSSRLTQTLDIRNTSDETQTAVIAVPAYSALDSYTDNISIILDGKSAPKTFRFANTTWNPSRDLGYDSMDVQDYDDILAVSISAELEELENAEPYTLVSFDDSVPMPVYSYETTCKENNEPLDPDVPGAILNVSRMEDIAPFDFYSAHVQKYSKGSLNKYKNELANRVIDYTLQSGADYIDCATLSSTDSRVHGITAAVIEFDIAPGQSRKLKVDLKHGAGYFVPDGSKKMEYYYPIFTEPLDSFGGDKTIQLTVNKPSGRSSVSLMPNHPQTADKPPAFAINTGDDGNFIVLCETRYRPPTWFESLNIYGIVVLLFALTVLFMLIAVPVKIYYMIKRDK